MIWIEIYIVHYPHLLPDFHKKNPLDLIHSFLLIVRSYYEKQAKEKLKELRQVAKNKTFSGEYESDLDYDEEVNYFLVFLYTLLYIQRLLIVPSVMYSGLNLV